MLEVKNLTKKFGDIVAVDNLTFQVELGEIVGLIGENGSGKTTTIKMLAGLFEPSFGQILLSNIDMLRAPEQTRVMLGYIPDEPAVYDKLTGDEFLHFVSEAFNIDSNIASKKISELKKIYPMTDQDNGYFEDYSRGTRQKYMIMAAMLHEAPLLLVDEPIVGLDPISAKKTEEIFSNYVADKLHAILLCTHTLTVAEKICNRFIILKKGKLFAEGNLEQLRQKTSLANGSLEEIYLKLNQKNE